MGKGSLLFALDLFSLLLITSFGLAFAMNGQGDTSSSIFPDLNKFLPELSKSPVIDIDTERMLVNLKPSENSVDAVSSIIGKSNVIRVFGTDSILANLDKVTLDKLSKDSRVVSVQPPRKYEQLLQDAVPLIDADLAWQRTINGVNVDGVTQTVCVVDGGSNFSHPDLAAKNALSCNMNCENSTLGCYSDCTDLGDSHGTRVAGIVGANGGINGVAKGAKLVGADVFDSNENAWSDSIRDAIDWCISNSTTYNISVISMSLGTGPPFLFNDYCDDFDVTVVQGINNAVAAGISVVVASGNDGNTTSIDSPACASNAIPVGATNKSDYVATYSNYNSMVRLFAPGSSINSTSVSGKYAIGSGTSFSTPMVSGAIAMINQVLRSKSLTMTPKQIEDLLFNNSDPIVDLPSSYGRINVDKAIAVVLNMSANVEYLTDFNITSEENNYRHLSLNNANLFFYTPFDFNSPVKKIVHDFSSNNYDGSVKGGAIYNSSCLYGGCYWFDGLNDANDDYLNFSVLKNSSKFGSSFTVSMWINNQEQGGYIVRDMMGTWTAPNALNKSGWVARMSTLLKPQFVISNGTKVVTATTSTVTLLNKWYHVVVVYDASVPSARVYLNGVAGPLKSGTLNVPTNGGRVNRDFKIGMSSSLNKIWRGNVDEVMIFDKALNASDISSLYKNQTIKFYSKGQKVFSNLYGGSVGAMVNVTIVPTFSYLGTNYTVRVGSRSGDGYSYGSEYNVVNGKAINIPISTPTNLSVAVLFNANPNMFYSPLMSGNATVIAF